MLLCPWDFPLEWVAISFSRGSSQPRDWTQVSRIVSKMLYHLSHQGSPFKFLMQVMVNSCKWSDCIVITTISISDLGCDFFYFFLFLYSLGESEFVKSLSDLLVFNYSQRQALCKAKSKHLIAVSWMNKWMNEWMVPGQWYPAAARVLLLESRSDHHPLSYVPSRAPPQVMSL